VVSARLAARRDLSDLWGAGHALRLAAYSGFRPATLNELHRPFRVGDDITEANAALEPERLRGVEAGWAWRGTRASLSATAFWNQIEDPVVNVTLGAGPGTFPRAGFVPAGGVLRQRRNAGTIEALGLEIDGRLAVGDRLTLRAAVSGTDARMDGGTGAPQLTGLRPAQAPIWSATAGADWRPTDRLSLSADLRWESRRFDDDLNSRVLDAALVASARADWALTGNTGLWLAADNLFDEEVEVSETGEGVAGFGPPCTVSAGIRLRY
jgi:outer membrane receptor protein involved in Fe transport